MTRASHGQGRHRQAWITAVCPCCTRVVQARRTLPGHPLHMKAHFADDGALCPCTTVDRVAVA